jgi:hypothetical protein
MMRILWNAALTNERTILLVGMRRAVCPAAKGAATVSATVSRHVSARFTPSPLSLAIQQQQRWFGSGKKTTSNAQKKKLKKRTEAQQAQRQVMKAAEARRELREKQEIAYKKLFVELLKERHGFVLPSPRVQSKKKITRQDEKWAKCSWKMALVFHWMERGMKKTNKKMQAVLNPVPFPKQVLEWATTAKVELGHYPYKKERKTQLHLFIHEYESQLYKWMELELKHLGQAVIVGEDGRIDPGTFQRQFVEAVLTNAGVDFSDLQLEFDESELRVQGDGQAEDDDDDDDDDDYERHDSVNADADDDDDDDDDDWYSDVTSQMMAMTAMIKNQSVMRKK